MPRTVHKLPMKKVYKDKDIEKAELASTMQGLRGILERAGSNTRILHLDPRQIRSRKVKKLLKGFQEALNYDGK